MVTRLIRQELQDDAVMRATVTFLLVLVWASSATADTLTGRVIKISDGDTLTVLDTSFNQHKIRLTGIDAPESEQPFGTVSHQNLANRVFGRASHRPV